MFEDPNQISFLSAIKFLDYLKSVDFSNESATSEFWEIKEHQNLGFSKAGKKYFAYFVIFKSLLFNFGLFNHFGIGQSIKLIYHI